ncbi:hypothetical protein [Paenibacillus sp. BC26]|uniref:hypothetical protein n=1 Tax=Paenibacillus sp. BC26 TaxID=1881032 RepID=UPI0008DF2A1E|nr:hypothetical protein [Paenibacillus sp. BC26]SFS70961.1 hypothetical protein SAMN05428962_2409 [Paenibacillus sp. BC26]
MNNEVEESRSCLFGYLSWSLFPQLVPPEEIIRYVAEVERIIEGCHPHVIYFHQKDIGNALARIFARRQGDTESQFIEATTRSKYGQAHQLRGIEGTVAYWKAYRAITDEMFERLNTDKLSIDNSDGVWPEYELLILSFLGLESGLDVEVVSEELQRFAGVYYAETESDSDTTCEVRFDRDTASLIVDRLPHVWTQTPLIPSGPNVFDVQSLPLQVHFAEEDSEQGIRLRLTGPTLLSGNVDVVFVKQA